MNARKRRPARRKPQRWRAWGCAFAMGIVATPITTTQVLANSQPLANWAAVVAWSGNQPMPHSSGSDSFGTVHQPPRDLWGDVDDSPAYRSAGTVAETPAESEDAAQQDLWKDDTKEPAPIEPAMPREWQAPAGDASPLPPADPSSEITRLDFRQRMIATMGWTTVASHSSDVCRTPGSPGKASQSAESSAQEILDGFRAKGLGRRAVARSSTSAPAPTNPTSLHSSPSLKQPIRSAKKPPRVTSVDSPEVTAPHTIQADFRLEPVEPDANGLAAKIAPNVVQLSGAGSPGERLTSVSAEIVELSDIAKLPAELPRTAAPTEAAPAQPASSFTLAPPQADRLAAVQIPKNSKRLPEPSLGLGGVKSGVSDEEPAIGTSQPTRLPPTKMPLLRGPVVGGVSDHDDPSTIVGKAERA